MNPSRTLSDQEQAELARSKSMSPAARLNWLAAALAFVRDVEKAKRKNGLANRRQ